jgi:hypothetical protein
MADAADHAPMVPEPGGEKSSPPSYVARYTRYEERANVVGVATFQLTLACVLPETTSTPVGAGGLANGTTTVSEDGSDSSRFRFNAVTM